MTENQWMFNPNTRSKKKQKKRKHFIPEPIYPFFKFCASLQLAVPTILALMIMMASGTVIESLHGAQAAKLLVYETWWFFLTLFFLGLNVFMVTIDRIPWQKKHIGFLVTHLGIIIILVGSFITQTKMIDGQMPIAENDSESFVTLPSQPLIYMLDHANKKDWIYPFRPKALPWKGKEEIFSETPSSLKLELLKYYPKARGKQSIQEALKGPIALKVNLKNNFVNQALWLVEKDSERNSVVLGPAKITFSEKPLEDHHKEKERPEGTLLIDLKGEVYEIPMNLEKELPQKVTIEDTPYEVEILKLFRDAEVVKNDLRDQADSNSENFIEPSSWNNPAIELVIRSEGFEEHHTVFAKFPDFPTVHGLKPSAIGATLFYRLPHLMQIKEERELRFLKKDGKLFYQILNKDGLTTGSVIEGKPMQTGWMDLTFEVEKIYKHSQLVSFYDPQSNISQAEDLSSVVQVALSEGEKSEIFWLEQGVRKKINFNDLEYDFIYGNRRIPIGFEIFLKDFKIAHNPGTQDPASFSSDVVLRDPARGLSREVHIAMNEPLEHRGFKVYQAAYRLIPGEPEISVFSVARDPGTPFKYLGSILIVLGATIMFSMRKFSSKKKAGRR